MRKLVILMELMKEAEGKSIDKMLPMIMEANKSYRLKICFTKDESDIMIDALTKKHVT